MHKTQHGRCGQHGVCGTVRPGGDSGHHQSERAQGATHAQGGPTVGRVWGQQRAQGQAAHLWRHQWCILLTLITWLLLDDLYVEIHLKDTPSCEIIKIMTLSTYFLPEGCNKDGLLFGPNRFDSYVTSMFVFASQKTDTKYLISVIITEGCFSACYENQKNNIEFLIFWL